MDVTMQLQLKFKDYEVPRGGGGADGARRRKPPALTIVVTAYRDGRHWL